MASDRRVWALLGAALILQPACTDLCWEAGGAIEPCPAAPTVPEDALCPAASGQTERLILSGAAAEDLFGLAVEAVDLTGDGLPELVVGAPGADRGQSLNAGRVYLFEGGSICAALSSGDAIVRLGVESAAAVIEGTEDSGAVGMVLEGLRDLDGDDRDELLLGSPSTRSDRGTVALFLGSAQPPALRSTEDADLTLTWDTDNDALGRAVLDLGADGVAVTVAHSGEDRGEVLRFTRAELSDALGGALRGEEVTSLAMGEQNYQLLGRHLARGPQGRLLIGAGSRWAGVLDRAAGAPEPLGGLAEETTIGGTLLSAWERADETLLVAAHRRDVELQACSDCGGQLRLYRAEDVSSWRLLLRGAHSDPGLSSWSDHLGWSLAGAGDVDGAAGAELLVGAPGVSEAADLAGRVYLLDAALDASGLGVEETLGEAQPHVDGLSACDLLGFSVAPLGDLDGSGAAVILGAPGRPPRPAFPWDEHQLSGAAECADANRPGEVHIVFPRAWQRG